VASTSTDAPTDVLAILASRVPAPAEMRRLRREVLAEREVREPLAARVRELSGASPDDADRQAALVGGLGSWLLGDDEAACEWLERAGRSATVRWCLGTAHMERGRTGRAIDILEALEGSASDDVEVAVFLADALCRADRAEDARKVLKGKEKAFQASPDFQCQMGVALDLLGYPEEARERYERAIELDEEHAPTLFRMAYNADLQGDDETAEELYCRCVAQRPPLVNALMNLGVLYEDHGRFEEAAALFKTVLDAEPTNARARMYYNDARSSLSMAYDEDLERKEDRRAQILRIPVTDFELSVRSRNCLAKMQITSLGDLVQKSEAELLSYKNFGETSLQEIKDILAQKGLRLGMTEEEIEGYTRPTITLADADATGADPEVYNKPLSDLELSVRSRNCVTFLGVTTVGELCQRTEAELMACKNFGQTSMNEIKQKLAELGVSLKSAK
jgi:DNA-directed RNA polymerase subunit alpha